VWVGILLVAAVMVTLSLKMKKDGFFTKSEREKLNYILIALRSEAIIAT
jgi:hypothetical protein